MTGPELQAIRMALGMTQKEFAEKFELSSVRTLQQWEISRRPISPLVEKYITNTLKYKFQAGVEKTLTRKKKKA